MRGNKALKINDKIIQSKILIVDDQLVNVILLEQILDEEGYEKVITTTDPRDVVGICQSEAIDLILLDIRMPHMTGIEVMLALKDEIPSDEYIPILVLTAQTDEETRQAALAAGAKDFLTKPFQQWEVLQRIHNMLETRIYYNNQRIRADVLENEVVKRTKQIFNTQLEVVRRLGRAGEYRDNETGAHVLRMSQACKLLALKAGLGDAFAELILQASPMHDVGKIGIPDQILLKPGRLTVEERAIMEKHVEIGVDIIGKFQTPMFEMSRQIAATHHEKWDGSGYPKGVKGTDIPMEGRIAAICDVFDALTSTRPYKKAWPVEDAVAFLKENTSQHFDPGLVDLFIEIIPDVLRLRTEYPDEGVV